MYSPDEVAGIVDVFGVLTHEQAERALSELAYRHGGKDITPEAVIENAIEAFALVEFDDDGDRLIAPGPAAFPELPEGGEDLPYILEVNDRSIDRSTLERAATERLRSETDQVVVDDDGERAAELLEVSYDIETWGGADLSSVRDRLETVTDDTN